MEYLERAAPEFAQRVRALFDAHRHETSATLRGDGSPRISGIEATFKDSELAFRFDAECAQRGGSTPDPLFTLHSATVDFYADIAEVVRTHLNERATMLVVDWWTPTHELRKDRVRIVLEGNQPRLGLAKWTGVQPRLMTYGMTRRFRVQAAQLALNDLAAIDVPGRTGLSGSGIVYNQCQIEPLETKNPLSMGPERIFGALLVLLELRPGAR